MPGYKKLGKDSAHRKSMLRNLTTDLLRYGRIQTTQDRAKETRRMAEKMITLGKKDTLAARRQALEFITREDVVTKVFKDLSEKYATRAGGYTRVTRTGPRRGDGAEMAVIELV